MSHNVPHKTYNSKVLVGNWFYQNSFDEHKLAMYNKKKERKKLLVIGIRNLFENFLRYVPLSMSTKGLTYAPDIIAAPSNSVEPRRNGVVLSVTIDPTDVDNVQTIIDDLPLVGSPLRDPCARNTFLIESDEGKVEGEPVCYGDTIYLRLAEKTEIPLYAEIVVPNFGAPVGKCGFPTTKLRLGKSGDARFKVLHARPDLRQLTDGSPCPPFEKVVIAHAPNNAPLCVEANIWTLSFFSFECEISAQKKITPGKKVDPNTMWTFVVGSV
ncbi:hypothetical protein RUM44_004373 [Polyplax serrata]